MHGLSAISSVSRLNIFGLPVAEKTRSVSAQRMAIMAKKIFFLQLFISLKMGKTWIKKQIIAESLTFKNFHNFLDCILSGISMTDC